MTSLKPKGVARERILLLGGAKVGKTSAYLSIAKRCPDNQMYVLDSDFAMDRMLEGGDYPNVHVTTVDNWTDYVEGTKAAIAKCATYDGPNGQKISDDWLVIDFLSGAWDAVQSWYIDKRYGTTPEDYFTKHELANKKGNALEGDTDWCADPETEILTERGWLHHWELVDGDNAYTLDVDAGTAQFEPILDINVCESKLRQLVAMKSKSHDSLTTAGHRWFVHRYDSENGFTDTWTTSAKMGRSDRIPHATPRFDAPMQKHTDALVEIVAWFWNEGWINRDKRGVPSIYLSQKKPVMVERIRSALTAGWGPDCWTERLNAQGVTMFYLRHFVRDDVLRVAPDKMPSHAFICSLTAEQARMFVETCIDGDGSRRGRQVVWTQNSEESVRRFEMACALAGIATRTHERIKHDRYGQPEFFEVQLLQSAGVWPAQTQSENSTVERVIRDGEVWCPVTPSGTWLARRNGTVYFTGNSVINKNHKAFVSIIKRAPCHVLATTTARAIGDRDDPSLKSTFGAVGSRPEGQKHLSHDFHTLLALKKSRLGEYQMTSAGDRQRKLVENQGFTDFASAYLVGIAGWRPA